jgi:hypothetical protein
MCSHLFDEKKNKITLEKKTRNNGERKLTYSLHQFGYWRKKEEGSHKNKILSKVRLTSLYIINDYFLGFLFSFKNTAEIFTEFTLKTCIYYSLFFLLLFSSQTQTYFITDKNKPIQKEKKLHYNII